MSVKSVARHLVRVEAAMLIKRDMQMQTRATREARRQQARVVLPHRLLRMQKVARCFSTLMIWKIQV